MQKRDYARLSGAPTGTYSRFSFTIATGLDGTLGSFDHAHAPVSLNIGRAVRVAGYFDDGNLWATDHREASFVHPCPWRSPSVSTHVDAHAGGGAVDNSWYGSVGSCHRSWICPPFECDSVSCDECDSVGVLLSVSRPRVGVATAHTARAGESLRLAREREKLQFSFSSRHTRLSSQREPQAQRSGSALTA